MGLLNSKFNNFSPTKTLLIKNPMLKWSKHEISRKQNMNIHEHAKNKKYNKKKKIKTTNQKPRMKVQNAK